MNFSLVSGWWWMFVTSRRGEGEIWGEEKHRQVSATLVSDHCYWYLDFSIDYLYFLIEIYTGTATLSFYLLAFLAALAALYLPFVPESVSDCYFRILPQRVTFETWDPSDIWSGWWGEKKVEKGWNFFNFFSHFITLIKCLKGLKSQKSLFVSKF